LLGNDAFSSALREKLIEKLAVGSIVIADTPEKADTAITGSAKLTGLDQNQENIGTVTLQLVNISGDILWRGRYRGTADQVAGQVRTELQRALRKE
jgi:hypothetical protein